MKIPNTRKLQQIASNHSVDIVFKNFMNFTHICELTRIGQVSHAFQTTALAKKCRLISPAFIASQPRLKTIVQGK